MFEQLLKKIEKKLTEPVPRCKVDICVVSWGIILYCGLLGSADGIIYNRDWRSSMIKQKQW